MRTTPLEVSDTDGSLDFIGRFCVFVFITGFSLFNFSNPMYHTEHGLAPKNTPSGQNKG